jgi:hypothetical protein
MAMAERAKFVTAIGVEMKKRLPLLTEVWTAQVGAPRGFANYVIQWNTAEDGGAACCSPSPVLRCIGLTERSCEATTPSPAEHRPPSLRVPNAANPRVHRAKVAGGKLVADLRGPRSDIVKAVVAHIGTSRLGKPHSQVQLTLFSVVEHQANLLINDGR